MIRASFNPIRQHNRHSREGVKTLLRQQRDSRNGHPSTKKTAAVIPAQAGIQQKQHVILSDSEESASQHLLQRKISKNRNTLIILNNLMIASGTTNNSSQLYSGSVTASEPKIHIVLRHPSKKAFTKQATNLQINFFASGSFFEPATMLRFIL